MRQNITVFCGSADHCPAAYLDAAEALGRLIARQGRRLIYGSGQCGLMGRTAKGAKEAGGPITGINVRRFQEYLPYPGTDEFIMTETLAERKLALIRRGDACIALPGGVGTLDELMDVYALAQIGAYDRPIGLLNVNGYWDGLLAFFRRALQDGLLNQADYRRLIVSEEPEELLRLLDDWRKP